ncbi:MAG: hypothetical protein IPK77_12145 [Cellvibrio sp.]|nr:hypothetical protein [Cellvibrio sp.]
MKKIFYCLICFMTSSVLAYENAGEVTVTGYRNPNQQSYIDPNVWREVERAQRLAADLAMQQALAQAQREADEQAKKVAECESTKAGASIDANACKIDVGYKGGMLINSQCGNTSSTRTTGTFSWYYTFEGATYGFSANIPPQSYDEFSWYSDQYACEKIVSSAVSFIKSNCDIQAQYAVHEKCDY